MANRSAVFQAIGTEWQIQVADTMSEAVGRELSASIEARIVDFDKAYSRFRADSWVTKMSQQAGHYKLPNDAYQLLQFYEQLYKLTDGKVTLLIGQTLEDAGYDANYSFHKQTLQTPPSWQEVITFDQDSITLKQPALLDFGAAGKGYLVDIISNLLEATGVKTYLVNAGGDIRYRTAEQLSLEVGLENPYDTSEAVGAAKLLNASICASAGSKRKWAGMHHIIDPTSLQSPTKIAATWVVAEETMIADGIATALFFTEPAILREYFSFSYAILYDDMSLLYAADFPITTFEAGLDGSH